MHTQPHSMSRVKTVARAVALASAWAMAVACGSPTSGAPTTAAGPPAAAPPPTSPTSAPLPTAVGVTTPATASSASQAASASQATGQAASTSQAAPSAAAAVSDVVHLVLDSSASSASYHAREQLVGKSLPTDAVGTTPGVTGTLVIGLDGAVLPDQSTITVDLTRLKSDESRRDNFIQGNTLQTSQYPMATFVARQVQGLATPLPRDGQATFQLLGDLTVHGVTRPATWQVSAQFADATVSGNATTNVNLTDFGMTAPKAGPVLSVEDGLTLQLAFTANRDA